MGFALCAASRVDLPMAGLVVDQGAFEYVLAMEVLLNVTIRDIDSLFTRLHFNASEIVLVCL